MQTNVLTREYVRANMDDSGTFIIPHEIEKIETQAFKDCKELKTIIIPEGVETIGDGLFFDCHNLVEVILPSTLKIIPSKTFYNCKQLKKIAIPYGIKKITLEAFIGCRSLEEVILPSTLEIIGFYAFSYCINLKTITIPEGVETSGGGWFSDCENLEEVILPSTLKVIPSWAFSNCKQLKKIVIPYGIKEIGHDVFKGCTNLEEVILSPTLETINMSSFRNCSSLKTICIPEGVKTIDRFAFANCTNLEEVILPSTLKTIGVCCFFCCTSLKTAIIPENKDILNYFESLMYDSKLSNLSITVYKTVYFDEEKRSGYKFMIPNELLKFQDKQLTIDQYIEASINFGKMPTISLEFYGDYLPFISESFNEEPFKYNNEFIGIRNVLIRVGDKDVELVSEQDFFTSIISFYGIIILKTSGNTYHIIKKDGEVILSSTINKYMSGMSLLPYDELLYFKILSEIIAGNKSLQEFYVMYMSELQKKSIETFKSGMKSEISNLNDVDLNGAVTFGKSLIEYQKIEGDISLSVCSRVEPIKTTSEVLKMTNRFTKTTNGLMGKLLNAFRRNSDGLKMEALKVLNECIKEYSIEIRILRNQYESHKKVHGILEDSIIRCETIAGNKEGRIKEAFNSKITDLDLSNTVILNTIKTIYYNLTIRENFVSRLVGLIEAIELGENIEDIMRKAVEVQLFGEFLYSLILKDERGIKKSFEKLEYIGINISLPESSMLLLESDTQINRQY